MAATLFLVTRAAGDEGLPLVNGVVAVLINKDSGQTTKQVIAAAIAQCETANNKGATPVSSRPNVFPDDYFDTVTTVGTPSGLALDDDTDAIIFGSVTGDGTNGVTSITADDPITAIP